MWLVAPAHSERVEGQTRAYLTTGPVADPSLDRGRAIHEPWNSCGQRCVINCFNIVSIDTLLESAIETRNRNNRCKVKNYILSFEYFSKCSLISNVN